VPTVVVIDRYRADDAALRDLGLSRIPPDPLSDPESLSVQKTGTP
jgi:hypothetical protein